MSNFIVKGDSLNSKNLIVRFSLWSILVLISNVLLFVIRPLFVLYEVSNPVDFGMSVGPRIYMLNPVILVCQIALNILFLGYLGYLVKIMYFWSTQGKLKEG